VTLEVDRDRWEPLLEKLGCTDAYYLRGFLESAALALGGEAAFLHLGDQHGDVVFACIVRGVPGTDVRDATTFAYGGPLGVGVAPPVEQFYEAYERWCTRNRVVTTFVRFHPLFGNQRFGGGSFHLEQVEGSVSWELDGDLLARMHPHHRRLIRKAQAAKVHIMVSSDAPERFEALYDATMRKVGASGVYFFPPEYWRELQRGLGQRLVYLEARLEGVMLAGVLCFATPPWLHYHVGATSDAGRRIGASHLLLYSAARHGQDLSFEQFQLGSGVGGGGGSLLDFKQRFSPGGLREQWFGKAVHDRERYLELAQVDDVSYHGFFPAYRRP
jgi:serine/alanine adding enzyme